MNLTTILGPIALTVLAIPSAVIAANGAPTSALSSNANGERANARTASRTDTIDLVDVWLCSDKLGCIQAASASGRIVSMEIETPNTLNAESAAMLDWLAGSAEGLRRNVDLTLTGIDPEGNTKSIDIDEVKAEWLCADGACDGFHGAWPAKWKGFSLNGMGSSLPSPPPG